MNKASHTSARRYRRFQRSTASALTATLWLPLFLTFLPTSAQSRAFTSEVIAGTTLRCNTARTGSIPEEILDRYGITQDADAGLLSCVIQRQEASGAWRNQRGIVRARASTITGISEELQVREILDESAVGYVATYALPTSGPLSFDVLVEAEDAEEEIRIEFDDLRPRQ